MTTNTIFDFATTEKYSYKLKEDVMFHLEKSTESVARLYFTDENNTQIDKPQIFHVRSYKHDGESLTFTIEKPINNNYFLCWTDSYSITYDQKEILTIDSQRTWNIHSKCIN
jgi:hypothetical protein